MSENHRLDEWKKAYDENHYANKNQVRHRENLTGLNSRPSSPRPTTTSTKQHISYNVVVNQPFHYVGFWRRVFAFTIDSLLIALVYYLLKIPNHLIINMFIYSLYSAILTSSQLKGTIGKLLIGAIVVDMNGNQISFLRAICRYFAMYLSAATLLIGFLMVGFHGKKRGLHDLICETMVINKE
ncbi:RDD family protein [Bacillus massilinigeriensis]|uniref:RDD family protein n=1 Tax=Bacillus massilionigeriensis TaxID=1805475 RepID=UPI00096B2BB7|nr:RDD family protein [Bacillus massilionigeriensis]